MKLTRDERWAWLKRHHTGYTIPWDRMALPSHDWFNNYKKIYNTKIPISVPSTRAELKEEFDTFLGILEVLYVSTDDKEVIDAVIKVNGYSRNYLK